MFLNDHYQVAIKQFLYKAMGDSVAKHEAVIDKICSSVNTNKDFENTSAFLAKLYEVGFLEAVDQHKEILKNHGLKVTIGPDKAR